MVVKLFEIISKMYTHLLRELAKVEMIKNDFTKEKKIKEEREKA